MHALGALDLRPALAAPELLGAPVRALLEAHPDLAGVVAVAPIDPDLADTAAFCDAYDIALSSAANCVVVTGRRADITRTAACVVLATTRADVNGLVKRMLDVRKVSFATREEAVTGTGMEFGGITPLGLPSGYRVLVDDAVAAAPLVVVGSGLRRSKLVLPGSSLAVVGEVVAGLGR